MTSPAISRPNSAARPRRNVDINTGKRYVIKAVARARVYIR